MHEVRSLEQRQADARAKLTGDPDVWVASAHSDAAHLVPLSLHWDGREIIVATPTDAITVRNVRQAGRARLMLGSSRDVVMIDSSARTLPGDEMREEMAAGYAARTGWDPRTDRSVAWTYICFLPERMQVWRDVAEMEGRLVMADGRWLS